ncbi:MAG: NAD(P)H-dependent oxidoreductase [Pseudomonadota bacterium]|uniref:NADPH-dependent FMN reductase n=1 Tax=Phenylobacterium sp. TaxID=1871053 RepID=UPI0025F9CC4B|nr:NAD(P)H-dependent oxidoreductase [Phenylobacterium sp.]MBT9470168.1 NAD(P)H-dependent oxidoreductase [Phenylobacterium sp.]
MTQPKLLAIAGSTRRDSFNQRLLNIAAEAAGDAGAAVTMINLRDFNLPLYDEDLEASAFPAEADALRAQFIAHDGFLIASPEYNGSVSGVLKNAIDWASRPRPGETMVALPAFRGKVAGIMSASISPFGGLRGLAHLRQILGTIQTVVATEQVAVPFANKAFDGPSLVDPMPRQLIPVMVARVAFLAKALRPDGLAAA